MCTQAIIFNLPVTHMLAGAVNHNSVNEYSCTTLGSYRVMSCVMHVKHEEWCIACNLACAEACAQDASQIRIEGLSTATVFMHCHRTLLAAHPSCDILAQAFPNLWLASLAS